MRFLLLLGFCFLVSGLSTPLPYLMTSKDRVQKYLNGPKGCLSDQSLLQAPESRYSLSTHARSSSLSSPNLYPPPSTPTPTVSSSSTASSFGSSSRSATPTPSPTAEPSSTGSPSPSPSASSYPSYPVSVTPHSQRTPEPSLSGTFFIPSSNSAVPVPSHCAQATPYSLTSTTSAGGLRGSKRV
jgi:hypothetical protein